MCVLSCSVESDSLPPHRLQLPGSFVHEDSPGKNTGVGCHFLLQGIFPIQGSNPSLLHCRQILYCRATREAIYIVPKMIHLEQNKNIKTASKLEEHFLSVLPIIYYIIRDTNLIICRMLGVCLCAYIRHEY